MKILLLFLLLQPFLSAHELTPSQLAKKLKLSAGSKAIVQWERIFLSSRKMKRYKIDELSIQDRNLLKDYLIEHAIDSDQPTIAGV